VDSPFHPAPHPRASSFREEFLWFNHQLPMGTWPKSFTIHDMIIAYKCGIVALKRYSDPRDPYPAAQNFCSSKPELFTGDDRGYHRWMVKGAGMTSLFWRLHANL